MLVKAAAALLLAASATGAYAQSPYRVRDIHPGPLGSEPWEITPTLGGAVFAADDPEHGRELWRTDGTSEGTFLLKDIVPGPESSDPTELTSVGASTYFRAASQLWKTDGTAAGTVLVREWPGEPNPFPRMLIGSNSTLFFVATTLAQGTELWKSDGTAAGTVLVANIAFGSISPSIGSLTAFGGGVVFRAQSTGGSGVELWKSDGTAAGTTLVLDIAPGSASSSPVALTVANGLVFFRATHPASGNEPWVSDGTPAGTRLLKEIAPGPSSSTPADFALRNGIVYFSAFDPAFGRELFRTDGTSAGTVRVVELAEGPASGVAGGTSAAGGVTYLFADGSGAGDYEPYRTDGTAAGTLRVRDVNPGDAASSPGFLGDLAGRLYFTADDASGDRELWRTDGTEEGTEQAGDVNPFGTSEIDDPMPTINHLFFAATDGTSGRELWAVDVQGPQVDAGTDQQVDVGGEVTVLGSASLPGGGPLSFEWRDADGDVLGTSASLTLTLPPGRHVLTLMASYDQHRGSDSVVVTVGRSLQVTTRGDNAGEGFVEAQPGGQTCAAVPDSDVACDLYFPIGTEVTLTATPAEGTTFVGWSGSCAGTGSCQVVADGTQAVDARFSGPVYFSVDGFGVEQGAGSVLIEPVGRQCVVPPDGSVTCEEYFPHGTVVRLTPTPAAGSTFEGWNDEFGPCGNSVPCEVTLESATGVNAKFLGPRVLTIGITSQDGGTGSVVTTPPGAICSLTVPGGAAQCEQPTPSGQSVTLTPLPDAGAVFLGWSGACAGTGPCSLQVAAHTTVGAAFGPAPNQSPATALTAPAPGAVHAPAPATIALAATAADLDGTVVRVEFFANGTKVGESLVAPFGTTWAAPPGAYVLTARATDDDGAATDSAPVAIVVNARPTLVLTSPLPDASFVAPATVTLAADATDPDGTIVRVEFFEGAVSRGFDTTSPYAVAWSNVPAGVHSLTAVATDDRGGTVGVPFTVVVSARAAAAADAYVRDGEPLQNFGDEDRLHVRKAAGSNNDRWTYLRFSVSALSSVSGARLRLFGHLAEEIATPVNARVFAVANTTWNERTITWHNKPATGSTVLASAPLDIATTDARWYEWDLTAYVQAEKAAGRNVISIAVKNDVNTSTRAAFRSREANQHRPELLLTP